MTNSHKSRRGCVYFNFGKRYALHLVVSVHSLRRHYDGPIMVFLLDEPHTRALKRDLEKLGASVVVTDRLSKSGDRHLVFRESPYETTLLFDSDIIFRAPIDDLWEPLEREGALVTRFFPPPAGRLIMLKGIAALVGQQRYERAVVRVRDERVDINVGVMGFARPRGDGFLAEWSECMEQGRGQDILLLDEMSIVALAEHHPHYLADEQWNCPADEIYRSIDPAEAKILHFFLDGAIINGRRIGRTLETWTGRQWFEAYRAAKKDINLSRWRLGDESFPRDAERPFESGAEVTIRFWLKDSERAIRRVRKSIFPAKRKET